MSTADIPPLILGIPLLVPSVFINTMDNVKSIQKFLEDMILSSLHMPKSALALASLVVPYICTIGFVLSLTKVEV